MSESKTIGFYRRLDSEWLDKVAEWTATGMTRTEVKTALFDLLKGKVAGGNNPGTAAQKTVTVLTRIWHDVNPEVIFIRDMGLKLLSSLSNKERIALHWSMALAGDRFFGDVSSIVGRLLKLQGDLYNSQVTRRICEEWGERSTVKRAAQRVVKSMVQWQLLSDTTLKGGGKPATKIPINEMVAKLLIEALLIHEGNGIEFELILRHPVLFPFELNISIGSLHQSPRFEIQRQGLDTDVVHLSTNL